LESRDVEDITLGIGFQRQDSLDRADQFARIAGVFDGFAIVAEWPVVGWEKTVVAFVDAYERVDVPAQSCDLALGIRDLLAERTAGVRREDRDVPVVKPCLALVFVFFVALNMNACNLTGLDAMVGDLCGSLVTLNEI
jgi:hypothetical protein